MLSRAREILENAVHEVKAFPGAQAAVLDDGRVLTLSVGTLSGEPGSPPVNDDTLYDLASITKPIGTAAAIAILMQQGKIGLGDHLGEWIEEAGAFAWSACTVEHLLSHTSGLLAWLPLYQSVPDAFRGDRKATDLMLQALFLASPESMPGEIEIYSDLDFFLLGLIVEKASGRPLNEAIDKFILHPLNMSKTSFRPKGAHTNSNIAPTGNCPWRKKTLQGEVHDDNAWACGSVAGQAGLFGTSIDLMTFAAEVIDGLQGDGILFDEELLDLFCTRPYKEVAGTFTLGWDTVSEVGTLTGTHFGSRSVGHHGFTGTSLWIDPEARVAMALLTNRVHYGDEKTKINQVRPRFFDAAWEDIQRR